MRVRAMCRRGLALALGLLAAAVLAEGLARVYAHVGGALGEMLANRDPLDTPIEPHGSYGYRQRPNRSHHYPDGTEASWNALGFRGPVVVRRKSPGTFRVILLGGSTTHGYQVNDDETIDAHMRALLRAEYPGIAFEVLNLGLDGYDSYQLAERFESDGLALSPDLVIVNSGINDVRNARFQNLQIPDPRTVIWEGNLQQLREQARRGGPTLRERLAHHSYAVRLPSLIGDNWSQRRGLASNAELRPQPDAIDYFEANIRRVAKLVEMAGAGLILSTPPSALSTRHQPDEVSDQSYWVVNAATTQDYRDALAGRLERIAAEADARGWPVAYVSLDLAPELFQDDCHLTGAGNRALAQGFVGALRPYLARARPDEVGRIPTRDGDALPTGANVDTSRVFDLE
jgi:lysophospholipase L1-like esterase